jgi:arylsulfatase A-like enzyme
VQAVQWRTRVADYGVAFAIVLGSATLGLARPCGTVAAGPAFATAVRERLRCEPRRAAGLVASCTDPAATCPQQVDRIAALVYAGVTGVPSSGLRLETRCQRGLAALANKYVKRRVSELGVLRRRSAKAGVKLLARTKRRCAGVPTGGAIPTAGDVCASLGAPFDAEHAPACVRAALEAITQDALGIYVPPNFVLVLTDDQRSDTLDVMPAVLEDVAARGVTFSQAFASTSLCCPDRASVLTGLYAHHHGVRSNAGAHDFDHQRDTIPRELREHAGYATALLGKYMVGTGTALGATVPPGWDEWHVFTTDGASTYGLYYGYQLNTNGSLAWYGLDAAQQPIPAEYSTDLLRDRALALVDRWAARPFFIEYAPFAPHTPAIPADRHAGTFALLPPARPPSYLEADVTDKPGWVAVYQSIYSTDPNSAAASDQTRIAQLETLLAVDEAVAALSDRLEALGLTDNTMLLFTSDNGFAWLEHWLTLKNYPYEESIRLPLVVRYPLLAPAPRTTDAMALPIDYYPTLAELAGIPGEPTNGASLVDVLRGTASSWRDAILLEHWGPTAFVYTSTGVRTAQWKLVETQASSGVTTELYDLLADPYEQSNVAGNPANAAVVATLQARLATLLAE